MMRSLLIKLAMLAVTLGSLVWIGSVTPVRQIPSRPAQPVAAVPGPAAVRQVSIAPPQVVSPADGSTLVANVPDVPAAPAVEESEPLVRQEQPANSLRRVHREVARQVDLNHATASDLQALPGIGPKLAQRVIDHRTARGPFGKIEDLQQVKGIGRKKLDRLRPHVLVTNTRSLARHKGTL
ncbi:MAG TPA: helix-hairpin-helix domain-containing protein [Nitrospira sp.]|nr:helix-hairpin-helix domain-containing protein [Nitrospira sp.]